MIHHQEAWQIYALNGEAVPGKSILPAESRKTNEIVVGAVHVWVWRRTSTGIEVLLQRRAKDKPTWPDSLDISVAGHVDANEGILEAALREGQEELGMTFVIEKLLYIFSYRNFQNGIKWVYLYEETEPQTAYTFNDGEVQSLAWIDLGRFEAMTDNPEVHDLVPHPSEYFGFVKKALHHMYENY